jgi:hypothetical protein
MTFIHGYLLGGLLLTGLPVLLHLVMRQKPRHLQFPAFRFLRQRHLSNRRKLRLQHLLLLLLRMAVIAALCLALARPRLAAERFGVLSANERPIAAVLIFDTSASMEYNAAGRTRLEEAKQRARELLSEMDSASQIALLDSGDDAGEGDGEWLSPALTQTRLDGLLVRPANAPLNRQLDRAVRLMEKLGEGEDPPPRFIYLFSDRARASWDPHAGPKTMPEGVRALFVDVGAEKPKDLAVEKVEIAPPLISPGERYQVRATLRALGADFDTELVCQIEADAESPPDKKAIQLAAGQARVVVFDRQAPKLQQGDGAMIVQASVRHRTEDALPFNNTGYATFQIQPLRKVLTVVGDKPAGAEPPPWKAWQMAMSVGKRFECDLRTAAEAEKLDARELQAYPAVCVFQMVPTAALWSKLERYVRVGGGLVLIPGGDEIRPRLQQFNEEGTKTGLLPAALQRIEINPPDRPLIRWSSFSTKHPIPAFFDRVIRSTEPDFGKPQSWPGVNAYWSTAPADKDTVVLSTYEKNEHPPALLERAVERGRVLQFTTPMATRQLDRTRDWHNYWTDSSFGLVLEDQVLRYLTGESTKPELNYLCGQIPRVPMSSSLASPPYTLDGPGLALAETNVKFQEGETQLTLPQATTPGNYVIRDANKRIVAGCSLNIRPEESDLERVPAEEIESVLGKDTLVQVGRTTSLKDALSGIRPPPLELLPWLMMALLVVLTVESLLANRFYRREEPVVSSQ